MRGAGAMQGSRESSECQRRHGRLNAGCERGVIGKVFPSESRNLARSQPEEARQCHDKLTIDMSDESRDDVVSFI